MDCPKCGYGLSIEDPGNDWTGELYCSKCDITYTFTLEEAEE